MKRAFIIGCGYTGTALAQRLTQGGVPVTGTTLGPQTGLNREAPNHVAPNHVAPNHVAPNHVAPNHVAPNHADQAEPPAQAPFQRLAWDLRQGDLPDFGAARGAVVYYMVSTLARQYDPQRLPHLLPMENALEGLRSQSVAGLIYLSSTSVYGDRQGRWVDESTPPTPESPWGQMRVDLEQRVWRFGKEQGIPACVVRLPEIYGPGRGPVQRLRQGYQLRFPRRYTNRIYIDDLVAVLAQLGERLDQRLLLATDNCPAQAQEVYTVAAQLLGMEGVARHQGQVTGDPNRLGLLRDSKRCSNRRLLDWLARPLQVPSYREGLPLTV